MTLFLENNSLIGDYMMLAPALREYKKQNPDHRIVYASPENSLDRLLSIGAPYIDEHILPKDVWSLVKEGDAYRRVQCTEAWNLGMTNRTSMVKGFGLMFGVELTDDSFDLFLTEEEKAEGKALFDSISDGKPVVVCARHSWSCSSHDLKINRPNKCFDNKIWLDAAKYMQNKGYTTLAVGSEKDLGEDRFKEWSGPKLYGKPLRHVAAMLEYCAAVVCVDTGIRFLASAVGCNLATISGGAPVALVHGVASREGQKLHEVDVPINFISSDLVKRVVEKVL